MYTLPHSPSTDFPLQETLNALAAAPVVDGIALFGSRAGARENPVSDHDLLILVNRLPVRIFQMMTHIDGRMADIVFLETAAVDHLLAEDALESPTSFVGMQLKKMLTVQITYDASGRLHRLQQHARTRQQAGTLFLPVNDSTRYEAGFWLHHGLYHMKRMAQSDDLVYLTAVDMMLAAGLSSLCRIYFQLRDVSWEGEKAAVRYLQAHDPAFIDQLRACLTMVDRQAKLAWYEQLVQQTLNMDLWQGDITAVYLRDTSHTAANIHTALDFWQSLFGSER